MEFTSKRRLLAAIRGEETDHIPFSPFLAYYFDFLPREVREKGQLEYLKAMGADPLLRGLYPPIRSAAASALSRKRERAISDISPRIRPKGICTPYIRM